MKSWLRSRASRGALAVALAGATGFGIVDLLAERGSTEASRRRSLVARVDRYEAVRRDQDWKALYAMVDPEQRRQMSEARFLSLHGKPWIRFHQVEAEVREVLPGATRAIARLSVEAELIPEELPSAYRNPRVERPEQLRSRATQDFEWIWHQGDWFWRLEAEIARGRDAKGRPLAPIDPGEASPQKGD